MFETEQPVERNGGFGVVRLLLFGQGLKYMTAVRGSAISGPRRNDRTHRANRSTAVEYRHCMAFTAERLTGLSWVGSC
jgi:hypothetical protein